MNILEQIANKRREIEQGVQINIQKSFEIEFEKAKHQDGDMHPNGKWVWVASAAGGKGDWRTHGGRAHSKSQTAGSGTTSGSSTTPTKKQSATKLNTFDTSTVDSLNNALKEYGFRETSKSINLRTQGLREVFLNGGWDKNGNSYDVIYVLDTNGMPHQHITAKITKHPKGNPFGTGNSETVLLNELESKLNNILGETKKYNEGKLSNKINLKAGNYFTEQGGIEVRQIFGELFPDLKDSKWTEHEVENAGYNYAEMSKLVSSISKAGAAMFKSVRLNDVKKFMPPEIADDVISIKEVLKQYQDEVSYSINKDKGELEDLLKKYVAKVRMNKNTYDNIKSSQMYSRLELAALHLAKSRIKQLALENIIKGQKEAFDELESINLNNYKLKTI